jgi:hypothetical protein
MSSSSRTASAPPRVSRCPTRKSLRARPADEGTAASGQPAVTVTLRVTVRQAVALAAAEAGARAVRLLARPA